MHLILSFLTSRIGLPLLIGGASILVVLGLNFWHKVQLAEVKNSEATAIKARDNAIEARNKAVEAANATAAVVNALVQDKKDSEQAVKDLATRIKKDQALIIGLSAQIKAQSELPANRVELSPVLQTTIDTIQQQRLARREMQ